MKPIQSAVAAALLFGLTAGVAQANRDTDTTALFRNAGQSAGFFANSYGYAVFPTIGKGGLVIGGAHGTGHVYVHGHRIGRTSVTQLTFGMQAGGQAFSEIIFFADKAALERFTAGNFEFGGDISAVAITAGASADAGTNGADASASADKHNASAKGEYHDGVAVFTIAKGGLMYEVAVTGEKFSYEANPAK
jgi:lipid-binding SYLF domain-containing protein